jgi:hypothetical protein
MKQVLIAFAAAPLASALLAAAGASFFAIATGGGEATGVVAGVTFFMTAAIGYVAAVLLGIPGYLLFRRFGWIRASHWVFLCSSVGATTGAVGPALRVSAAGNTDAIWIVSGAFLAAGAMLGAAAGLSFARIIKIAPPRVDEIAATFD